MSVKKDDWRFRTIPVQPYLKKFIATHERLEEGQPFPINKSTPLGNYLLGILCNASFVKRKDRQHIYKLNKNYSEFLYVELPERFTKKNFVSLTNQRIAMVNTFIRSYMLDGLLIEIRINKEIGVCEQATVMKFMQKCGITEDLKFESLIKSIQRYRKRKNELHKPRIKLEEPPKLINLNKKVTKINFLTKQLAIS